MSVKDLPTIGITVAGIVRPIEEHISNRFSQFCPAEPSIAAGNMGARQLSRRVKPMVASKSLGDHIRLVGSSDDIDGHVTALLMHERRNEGDRELEPA